MGRFEHAPLLKEILANLSSGYDEPNEEFPLATNITAADLKVDASDYVIGRNDLLQISLTDVTPGVETVKNARVSESGNISLPLIGPVQANGLTEAQLEKVIQQKYQDAGIVKNAKVSVTVIEARQRTFSIRGAVSRPGQYAIVQSDFRVLDALVLAGDMQVPQIEYPYVIRPAKQPADLAAGHPPAPGPVHPRPESSGARPRPSRIPPGAAGHQATGNAHAGQRPARPGHAAPTRPPVFINGNQNVQCRPRLRTDQPGYGWHRRRLRQRVSSSTARCPKISPGSSACRCGS